jgi:hypothetical protein
VVVNNTVAPGGIVFESNWNTLGNFSTALTDGGKWPIINQYDNPPSPGMSVVTGGPNGYNALRVEQRGPSWPVEIAKTNFIAQSTDYYLRYYFKTDDTSGSGDHIVAVGPGIAVPPGDSLTFMRKYGGSNDWRMTLSAYRCGVTTNWPVQHWGPGPRLANGQWYRLEYHVDFIDSTHVRVHPRIYNAAGTLVYDDDDFRQEGYGSSLWNGRSDWTLASFYAAGYSLCVDPVVMNDFGMGNNGQAGASSTGLYWYFAGVQVRSDTWPGPLGGASTPPPPPPPSGDTTAPTVSMLAPLAGATVSGSAVTVSATALDNIALSGVQFKLDGANLGVEDTSFPYSISWNSTTASNGTHTLTAVARDTSGNLGTSVGRSITVSNTTSGGSFAPPNRWFDNLEFPDMRSVAISGAVPLAGGEMASQPAGVWTGFFDIGGNTIVQDPTNCRDSLFCLRGNFTAGTSGVSNLAYTGYYSGGTPIISAPANAYYRQYVKFQDGFAINETSCNGKLLYLRDYTSGNPTVYVSYHNISTSPAGLIFKIDADYNPGIECNLGTCLLPFDGKWHSIEVHADAPNKLVEMWLDGKKVLQGSLNLSIVQNWNPTGVGFALYNNGSANGGCTFPKNQSMWIDDMAISTQRIGP